MGKKDEWYHVSIRKPTVQSSGALSYEVDCFRLGTVTASGQPDWQYEIPFSEIVQVEHKVLRDILRGRLKDGTEFDIRIQPHINPAKAARDGEALRAALDRIPVNISGSGSLRSVASGTSSKADRPNGPRPCATPGCDNDSTHGNFCDEHSPDVATASGCFGCLVPLVPILLLALAIAATFL